MIKKALLLALVMIFSCNAVFAETWQILKAGDKTIEIDTSDIYVDINNSGQDLYLYWVRTQKQDGIYQMLLASNCDHKKCVILKTEKIDYAGNILSTKVNTPPVLQVISPGSGAEAAFNYICTLDTNKFKSYDSYTATAQKALGENDFETARRNASNAYNEATTLSNEGYSPMHTADALDLLAKAYSGLGNYRKALSTWNEALAIAKNYTNTAFIQSLTEKRDSMQGIVDTSGISSRT